MATKVSKVTSISMHMEQGAEKTVHAIIKVSKIKKFKTFKIAWSYKTQNGKAYSLESSKNSSNTKQSVSIPDNAFSVSITVTPIDKEGSKAKTRKPFTESINVLPANITQPSAPKVDIIRTDGTTVTVSLSIQSYKDDTNSATYMDFWARKTKFGTNESTTLAVSKMVKITSDSVYTTWSGMEIGYDYEFNCRAVRAAYDTKTKEYSGLKYSVWSDWSNTIAGQYPRPEEGCSVNKYRDGRGISIGLKLPNTTRTLLTEIELIRDNQDPNDPFDWNKVDTLPLDYFMSQSDDRNPKYFTTDLGAYRYRIRARVVGDTEGRGTASAWRNYTEYVDAFEKHESPTTWTNNTKYEFGTNVDLYWTANSNDGSREWSANIKLLYSENEGGLFVPFDDRIVNNTIPVLDDVSAHVETLTNLQPGIYQWQVRTTNVQNATEEDWSEWSTTREFKVYAKPEVTVVLESEETNDGDGDVSHHFPLHGQAVLRNTNGQTLMYYTLKITNVDKYVESYFVSNRTVPRNTKLYSRNVDVSTNNSSDGIYYFDILANDVRLENHQKYLLTFDATFDSGVTVLDTYEFKYDAGDTDHTIDISLINNEYDPITATIVLKPEILVNDSETDIFDVYLYRLMYDGEAVLLNDEPYTSNSGDTILDPHPTLNSVTYRILAINRNTGKYHYQEAYVDVPDESSLVINWDENWVVDEGDETDTELRRSENSYGGNILKLRYNIERSYQNNKDVVLVEYIGRRNPVSYYGTQQGYSINWNVDVPYCDDETIELIDQLMAYDGDCYVREPSGKGFWANLKVSYNHKSGELKYAVTITATKVEGGA